MTARTDIAGDVIRNTAQIFCFVAALSCAVTQPGNVHRKPRQVNGGGAVIHFPRPQEVHVNHIDAKNNI